MNVVGYGKRYFLEDNGFDGTECELGVEDKGSVCVSSARRVSLHQNLYDDRR